MKNLLKIRPCFYDDEDKIIEIMNHGIISRSNAYIDAFDWIEGASWFKQLRASSHKLIVCEIEDEVVGWANLSPYRSGRAALSKVNEISFYVHNDFLRLGVAAKMIENLEDDCVQMGVKHLVAVLLSNNEASRALLEKQGYFVWGMFEGVVEWDEDSSGHVYMGKHL